MSDLTSIEKIKLEKLLEMGSGYVLNFTNNSFQEFIFDNLKLDIYDDKYLYSTNSKANRLRAFWNKEPNYLVGKLISDLLDYWQAQKLINALEISESEKRLFDECLKIAERLKKDAPVEDIEVIQPNFEDQDSYLLAKSIRKSLHENEPEIALDRLHTFTVKYLRRLCDKYSIQYDRKTPLHGLYGGYVKYLKEQNKIESIMTERILKSSISIFDSFNAVRNNQSLAHDNPILNYNESVLIFNNVLNSIRFIESLENSSEENMQQNSEDNWDDIPF